MKKKMSTTTSLECSIRFDSAESAKEQLDIFQKVSKDGVDCLGTRTDGFEFGETGDDCTIMLFAQVRGVPSPHDIINYFWNWIAHPERVERLNVSVDNLENGSYGILDSSELSRFTERWIPAVDVTEVLRQNCGDLVEANGILSKMLYK